MLHHRTPVSKGSVRNQFAFFVCYYTLMGVLARYAQRFIFLEKFMTSPIEEIRDYLAKQGMNLRKLRMRLNGNDAYEVEYPNGGFALCTACELKDRYRVRRG